jgi:hypothetical protein
LSYRAVAVVCNTLSVNSFFSLTRHIMEKEESATAPAAVAPETQTQTQTQTQTETEEHHSDHQTEASNEKAHGDFGTDGIEDENHEPEFHLHAKTYLTVFAICLIYFAQLINVVGAGAVSI